MDKVIGQVYLTTDYSKFKRLEGNRDVLKTRVEKVKRSIEKVGYINSPIIVNEFYEIVDGAARYEVAKENGFPIVYTIVPGIGIEHCIAMNTASTNWKMQDYVNCYAENGNESYGYLARLLEQYGKLFAFSVVCNALTGNMALSGSESLRNGTMKATREDYEKAIFTLELLKKVRPVFHPIKGRHEYYYMAVAFCYKNMPDIDMDRMIEKLIITQASLLPVANMEQALTQIELAYNNKARNKVYIVTEYKKIMDGRYSWYNKKWYQQNKQTNNKEEN